MPITDFTRVSRFFGEKTSSNTEVEPPPSGGPSWSQLVAADQLGASASSTRSQPRDPTSADRNRYRLPYAGHTNGGIRVGTILTSDLWREQNRALTLHAGPSSANWTLALRATDDEIRAGHVRFAQARQSVGSRGSRSTFLDFPKVGFEFQAGNILPIFGELNEAAVPYGLEDFYAMTELLDQPPLIPSGPSEGKHNYVWIFYTSLQLPQAVLKGYFDPGGMTWTDDAEQPTTLTWPMDFIVHEMSPEFGLTSDLANAYTSFMRDNPKVIVR